MNKFIKVKQADGFYRFINIDDITEIQFQEWEQKNIQTEQTEICHAYYVYSKTPNGSASLSKEEFELLLKNIKIIS